MCIITNIMNQRLVKSANSVVELSHDMQQILRSPAVIPNTEITFHLAADVPRLLKQKLFEMMRHNMQHMYENAKGWGWDPKFKWKELFSSKARYLICQQTTEPFDVLGFSHFRFQVDTESEPAEAVLYIYELQIVEGARKKGLGLRMMQILEALALKYNMRKTMLTVFKENTGAMKFYTEKAHYEVDASSPSCWDKDEDYEILCHKM